MKIYLKEVMKELKNLKLKNTEELKIKYIKILKNMGVLNIKWCNKQNQYFLYIYNNIMI